MDVGRVARLCLNRFLAAKQHAKALDATLFALFAHDAAHRVAHGVKNVGKTQAFGVELVGPAHGANQMNVVVLSIFGNGELGRDGVDGVDDVVELAVRLLQNTCEELIDVVAQQVFGTFDDSGGGVDVVDHGFHYIHFALADGAVKGDSLAVDVAGRDDVLVQDHKMTDAATGKCLAAVGAHAAAAKHQHRGVGEFIERLAAHDNLELGVACLDGSCSCGFGHRYPPMGKRVVFWLSPL